MKMFMVLCLTIASVQFAQATHLIGGYIQAKSITSSGLTYEVTAVIYMHAGSAADQLTSLTLCMGNGASAAATRLSQRYLQADQSISISTYRLIYSYFNPGTYTITTSISGRTNVKNITNSDNLTFTLATTLTTNTSTVNSTPTPAFPSTNFSVGVNQKLTLSLKATDADGDSLLYGLAKPYTSTGNNLCTHQIVPSYRFPNDLTRKGIIKLNNRTGEFVWDAPVELGSYSIAVDIYEYRNGILISQTTQEITVTVDDLPGTPSTIPPYEPAIEGAVITATISDADTDITLTTFPNPVDDQLQVIIQTSSPATAVVQLLDINGRKLHELGFTKNARQHEQIISMDSLTPGIYLLCANVRGRTLVRKIMKR